MGVFSAHAMKRLRTEEEQKRGEEGEEEERLFFELTSRFSNESTFKSVPNLLHGPKSQSLEG